MQIGPFRYKTLWELYAEIYGDFAEDEKQAFMLIFGPEFVHAYSELAGDAPAAGGQGAPFAPHAFAQNAPPQQHPFPQAPSGRGPTVPPAGSAPPPRHPPGTYPPQPVPPGVPQPPWPGSGPPRR
jgi:hypothetical protein